MLDTFYEILIIQDQEFDSSTIIILMQSDEKMNRWTDEWSKEQSN